VASYTPVPVDTQGVRLDPTLAALTERLAENTHDVWAKERMRTGWTPGPHRDDTRKEHPSLVPYSELPESEKNYDRLTALETIKLILALGYQIIPPPPKRRLPKTAPKGKGKAAR
jgi:hypothetical protein